MNREEGPVPGLQVADPGVAGRPAELTAFVRSLRAAVSSAFPTATTRIAWHPGPACDEEDLFALLEGGSDIIADSYILPSVTSSIPARRLVLPAAACDGGTLASAVAGGCGRVVVEMDEDIPALAFTAHQAGRRARVVLAVDGREFSGLSGSDQDMSDRLAEGAAIAALKEILRRQADLELVGLQEADGCRQHVCADPGRIGPAQGLMLLRRTFWATDGFLLPMVALPASVSIRAGSDAAMSFREGCLSRLALAMYWTNARLGLPMPVVALDLKPFEGAGPGSSCTIQQ